MTTAHATAHAAAHATATTATSADLSAWPASTTEPRRGDLAVGGVPLAELADRFGTPVHVLDEAEVRDRCRTYRDAFPDAEIGGRAHRAPAVHRTGPRRRGPGGRRALYRVLSVKHTGEHTYVAIDGGMSDNPRPSLYGVRYAPCLVGRHTTAAPTWVTVVGRHCEASDVLATAVELPGDIRLGDLLTVPVAGAYHLSMASAYNMVGRPPVAAVRDGRARLLVRREPFEDIRRRDVGL